MSRADRQVVILHGMISPVVSKFIHFKLTTFLIYHSIKPNLMSKEQAVGNTVMYGRHNGPIGSNGNSVGS